jgi:hypothetical protein
MCEAKKAVSRGGKDRDVSAAKNVLALVDRTFGDDSAAGVLMPVGCVQARWIHADASTSPLLAAI